MDIQFFRFEADFVDSLRCVPMIVRFRLDLCGIKLSLRAWNRFSVSTRARLATMRTTTPGEIDAYRDFLSAAILDVGEPVVPVAVDAQPAWMDTRQLPVVVTRKLDEMRLTLNGAMSWAQLGPLQRFALVKLTRGGHENENFLPALREFGMLH
ncbi:MAG: nitrate reductase associated protein [Aquabacterium sp.]